MTFRHPLSLSRRAAMRTGLAALSTLAMPAILRASTAPVFTHGVQSGDVDTATGMIWTRTDRPARVMIEVATSDSFSNARRLPPMDALPDSDFAVKKLLTDLAADQDIFYRLTPADLSDINSMGQPIVGRFRTAPTTRRDVRFVWSGDTAGQGWGIDDQGMATYATMAKHEPDFFIHSGDTIYADGPMKDQVELEDGTIWKNTVLIDAKRKVAETLDEYRGNFKYNLMDDHVRALNAVCPTFFQWDDHEVVNNWSPGKDLTGDDRYTEKSVPLLTARAARAFHEMTPIRYTPEEPGRIYRKIAYGPLLDIFFLDLRSYRAANNDGMETELAASASLMGPDQIAWLKTELAASKAVWKVIACDMPIGLIVWDNFKEKKGVEAIANGEDGPAKGRELEIADLLKFIRDKGVKNTVWLTADVHYTAAHHYSPDRAQFQEFAPFWEFVSGPLHAGTFGPNDLDMTFGPEVSFVKAPADGKVNLPPSAGMQFFGLVDVIGETGQMKVRLMDRADAELWSITLDPEA